jgi:hypothetical protein
MNNIVYYITRSDSFKTGENYRLCAMGSLSNDFRVKLTDWDGTVTWTSDSVSGNIDVYIPISVFTGEIYDISIETQPTMMLNDLNALYYQESDSWEPTWSAVTTQEYDIDGCYKVQVYLPRGGAQDCRKSAVAKLVRKARLRGFTYAVWYEGKANWKTFSRQIPNSCTSIVYIVTHGGTSTTRNGVTVNRLFFPISSDGLFGTENVYSHKDGLPGNLSTDPRVHSVRELGLTNSNHLRIIYMTACYQAKSDEMAREWLSNDYPVLDQVFVSFIGATMENRPSWQLWDWQVWDQWFDYNTWFDVYNYCSNPIRNEEGPQIGAQVDSFGDSQTTIN